MKDLQIESPPSPQPASGVHRVECTLSWDKTFPDKSIIFAEKITVKVEVDFDVVHATNSGIEEELRTFFWDRCGWIRDYEIRGLSLDSWKIVADD